MKRATFAAAVLCLAAAAGLYLYFRGPTQPVALPSLPALPSISPSGSAPPPATNILSSANSTPHSIPTVAPTSVPQNALPPGTATEPIDPGLVFSADAPPTLPPATLLENMRSAIRDFGAMFGGNPVGDNSEIARALNGGNSKGIKFLRVEAGVRLNSQSELVDSWGTPYFFHQLSATQTEIRSAGPDKIMWTADDLVTK